MSSPAVVAPESSERMTPLHWGVIALCFALNMLDGMDVLVMSYAAPLVMAEWDVGAARFGAVFSAALVGMAIGAVALAPLADRYGRRRLVLLSTVVIGLGMIVTAQTDSLAALATWRFLTGLGVGSMLATLTAVAAEFSTPARRNLLVGLVLSGYPVGATLAGFVAAPWLESMGWRWLFQVAGAASLLFIPLVFALMPESRAFLLARQPRDALGRVNRIQRRLGLGELEALPPPAVASEKSGPGRLFEGRQQHDTPWLWATFFLSFLALYFLLSWVPKLAVNAGLPLNQAVYAGALFNLGAFFGILILGHASNRFGLQRMIILFFALTVGGMLLFGGLNVSLPILLAEVFLLGFFMQGGFVGLYAAAAQIYPPEIRTTGVGWAIGAGRTGAIVGPWVGGHVIALGWSIGTTFAIFALPCLLAVLTTAQLRAPELRAQRTR